MEGTGTVLTVADVVARVRARKLAAFLPVLCGLALGAGYVLFAPPTFSSTAAVRVDPIISDRFGTANLSNLVNMATEREVALSSSVTALTAAKLGTTPANVRAALSVDFPQDTLVLNLRYSAGTAARAAAGANTVAAAYISYRESAEHGVAQKRLDDDEAQLTEVRLQLSQSPGAQTQALKDTLAALMSDRREMRQLIDSPGGHVITTAAAPLAPSSPKALVDVPLGVVVGALSGLALAVLRPRRQRIPVRPRLPIPSPSPVAEQLAADFDEALG